MSSTIVVIYESPASGKALKEDLTVEGYTVVSVELNDEPLLLSTLAKYNGSVGAVVLDLQEVWADKVGLIKKIRDMGYFYPVIVLTGSVFELYPSHDIFHVVKKPFKTQDLFRIVIDCVHVYNELRSEIVATVSMLKNLMVCHN